METCEMALPQTKFTSNLPVPIQHKFNKVPATMKNLKVHQSIVCPAIPSRLSRTNRSFPILAFIAVFACLLLAGNLGRAQVPTNQLHFAFTDASGTTTPSDTSLNAGAIVTTVTMYNAASPAVAVNLHGAVGSGVANPGVASTTRALDFTADTVVTSQTNQPANSKAVPPFVIAGGSAETGANPGSGSGNAALAVDLADAALANLGNDGTIGPFVARSEEHTSELPVTP